MAVTHNHTVYIHYTCSLTHREVTSGMISVRAKVCALSSQILFSHIAYHMQM